MTLIVLFALGAVLTAAMSGLLTPAVRTIAHRNDWVDKPDGDRKIHVEQTPRVGGLAIVGAFLVGACYFGAVGLLVEEAFPLPSWHIFVGGLAIAAAGFYDDLRGMHFSQKFVIQLLVALFLVLSDFRIEVVSIPFSDSSLSLGWWVSVPVTVLWIVGIINAVNLLDGMDGLAAGVTTIIFASLTAAYAVQGDVANIVFAIVVMSALLGFLYHNFNPASIFMGDTGSLFIGFLLAAFSLSGRGHANPVLAMTIPVIAMGLPVIDTALAIVRRFLARRPLFHPDRDHIHHRVTHRFGFSHRRTVLLLYSISIALGAVAFFISVSNDAQATLLLCGTALVAYLGLRALGYLRVRDTLRLLRKRYVRYRLERGLPVARSVSTPSATAARRSRRRARLDASTHAVTLDETLKTGLAAEEGDGSSQQVAVESLEQR